MRPIWASYYSDCSVLIFVVDASDDLVEAGTVLRASLEDFRAVNTDARVLVVLNKFDAAPSLTEEDAIACLHSVPSTAAEAANDGSSTCAFSDTKDNVVDSRPDACVHASSSSADSCAANGEGENHMTHVMRAHVNELDFALLKASALTGKGLDAILEWIVNS